MVLQCDREHEGIVEDKLLSNLILNKDIVNDGLKNSKIDEVFFTSGFGKNNAAKLFIDLFKIDYKATYNEEIREFTIPRQHFGRPIKATVLYSPSEQANIGISKSINYMRRLEEFQSHKTPVKAFKIDFYKEKFQFLNQ